MVLTPTAVRTEGRLRTHCSFCSMQCGIELLRTDGTPGFEVKPSPDFPVATGRLCQKGFHSMTHAIHPDRVLAPYRRTPDGAAWTQTSWEEALDGVAGRIRSLQELHGPDSVAVFGGGSLTNEVCYLLGKFTRVALRSRYIDYNGRFCMSSAAAAQNKAFGVDRGMSFPLEDIPEAKYIILAGTNIAECQPTMMPYLLAAKKRGAVVVTIDPRQTMTSKIADIHVPLQPGFDSVFVNGLLHVILAENLYDVGFVAKHVDGLEEVREAVKAFSPDQVSLYTGIPVEVIRTVARGFAKAETGIVMTARGVEQQVNGVEHTLNYINLCLLTGKIGRPGSGFGAVTGQANGQGGREHGQKADQLPGYRLIEDPAAREHVARVWGIDPVELPGKGVSAYELFDKVLSGEIKAMIVLGSNPVVSSPNSSRAREALEKLELLVVVDMFETETAELADWLLPGSSYLEAEGTLTNLEGRVFHRPQVFVPPGEVMPDYELICALAERLGRGAYFRYTSVEDVFDELCRASAGGKADYSGMSYRRLDEAGGLFWPCPAGGAGAAGNAAGSAGVTGSAVAGKAVSATGAAAGGADVTDNAVRSGAASAAASAAGAATGDAGADSTAASGSAARGEHPGTPRMFLGGVFGHANGRARLHGITPQRPAETTDREYPHILTTGRLGNHYLSGAQTRRTDALVKKAPVPVAEIHPTLAEKLKLRFGDCVRLTTRRGSLVFDVRISSDIHPTSVFVPFHWGGELSVNRLTNDALHPISRMPEFKICAVRVERADRETLSRGGDPDAEAAASPGPVKPDASRRGRAEKRSVPAAGQAAAAAGPAPDGA